MSEQTKARLVAQSPTSSASPTPAKNGKPGDAETTQRKPEAKPSTLSGKLEAAQAAPSDTPSAETKSQKPRDKAEREDRGTAPTQPARKHIAANDDLPSIGGLIYALQQRPSRSPFLFALVSTLVWLVLGGGAGWAMIRANSAAISGFGDFVQHPVALTTAATIVVPIALFWFLALLIWRAQELRLMASAMTEVAVRLAEPDKMAEQSVASLGQTIRRQVAAMNDAISRALGRAGELEAMVHNEVAALENSYGENELRIRRLIDELSSEREALTNNSERVSDALRGVGSKVSKDIAAAGDSATKNLATATETIADSLSAKSNKITAAMTAAGTSIDNKLAERGVKLTEALQQTSQRASEAVDVKANSLFQSLNGVADKISKNVPQLLEKLDGEQKRLNTIIAAASQNFSALETAIAQRTTHMDATLKERTKSMASSLAERATQIETTLDKQATQIDSSLAQRASQIDNSLKQRSEEIKSSLAQRIQALDDTVKKQAASIEQSLNKNTMTMSQVLSEGTNAVQRSSTQLAKDSGIATQNMTSQAQMLKDVSTGMLEQIHSLTQRFEKQGHAIMTAANALDSSNAKIDSILERRHGEISSLLDMVSNKAQDLDKMMRSYTGIIESSLVQVESRAKELSAALVQESTTQSRATIDEIEKLRADTRLHTNKAVQELQHSFEGITHQVANQLGLLTQQFGKTTREMRSTASQTAGEIESTRQELQRRMRDLPQETRQSTEAMRKAVSDQLRALGSLSQITSEHQAGPAPRPAAAPQQQPSSLFGQPQQGGNGRTSGSQLPLAGPALRPPAFGDPAHSAGRPAPYQNGGQDDLRSVTSNLAQQLAGRAQTSELPASPPVGPGPGGAPAGGVQITGGPPPAPPRDGWSVGDLLARASEPESNSGYAAPHHHVAPPPQAAPVNAGADLRLTDLARAIDHRTAADVWHRFQRGERDILSKQLYTQEGQTAFDEISVRCQRDPDFRNTVDRYIGDFERLLAEAESKGQDPAVIQNYLTSETGRVYLMLAHASGRLQ